MHIGIDISQIVYGTGVSAYTENLIRNLLLVDRNNDYLLWGGSIRRLRNLKLRTKDLIGNFKTRFLPISPTIADLLWNRLHILPVEKIIGSVDIFHSSDWSQPPTKAFKVTTVHDLSPVVYPDSTKKDLFRNIVKTHINRLAWVKEEVDRIIAVSDATKEDLIKYYQMPESKIRVIYEGVNPIFKRKTDFEVQEVKKRYQIFGDYILSIGSTPRKNIQRITRAFESIKGKYDLKYVVVGGLNDSNSRGVIYIKNVTDDQLACLYSGAKALVYASCYEGFGMPILEAFACRCPVVTSNLSSMPEIAGGASILVDPYEIDSIGKGIIEAMKTADLLIGKGLERLKAFSWEKTAMETLKVYEEVKG